MSEIIGRDIQIGFATEAVRGTAESTVDKWQKNVTANVVERAEHVIDDTVRGVLEDSIGRRVTQKWVEGDMEGIVHADSIGYLLASLYGKVTSAVVSGSVYSHIFALKQSIIHQSLTLFGIDGSAQKIKYAGCMLSTLELNATIDDYIRFTSNFIGRTASDHVETSSYDTEYDFIGRDITVKIADAEAGLAAATAIKLKSLDMSFDQGGIRDHVFGSYSPDNTYNSKMVIEGSFALNFANEAFKDLYLSDTAKYMQITIQGVADIGGALNPKITILLNKVLIADWNRSGGADELVSEEVSFKAFYNEADGEQSVITLQNLTASYPNVPSS